MKQKTVISCCYGIVFVLCSAFLFLPEAKSPSTPWIGLLCSALVLALCLLVVWRDGFADTIAHLRYTLGTVVTAFFALQLLVSGLAPFLPILWFLVIEAVLLTLCALASLPVLLGGGWVLSRQQEIRDRRQFILLFSRALSPLPARVSDPAARRELERLQEAVRFSDPMGVPESEVLEQRIMEQVDNLTHLVDLGDRDSLSTLCGTLSQLLKERNQLCKECK